MTDKFYMERVDGPGDQFAVISRDGSGLFAYRYEIRDEVARWRYVRYEIRDEVARWRYVNWEPFMTRSGAKRAAMREMRRRHAERLHEARTRAWWELNNDH